MMGVLAVATDPGRFAKLVLLTPSPRYVDDGDYRGGFSRNDIDELLESLESNYLGWSRSMAPVIMGASDRPELTVELGDTFCRTDPACAQVFARATFLGDNRDDLQRVSVPTLVIECEQDAIAPREVGAYVHRRIAGSDTCHAEHHRTLPPPQCSGGHRSGDRRLRRTEVSAEDLYENAPCGYVSADAERRIVTVNETLSRWLGYEPGALIGKPFTDLLTAGSRIHYETHFGPLLQLHGEFSGVTVDLVTSDDARLPVFITANTKTDAGGHIELLRIILQDASDRRSYERELLETRRQAELERTRAQVLARTLQRTLLPPLLSPPDGLEARAYFHAASPDEVGGDFYDLFPLSPQRSGFFLGDVCGKGANAAALTSLTRYTLRAAAVIDDDPVTVLHNLDAVFHQEVLGDALRFCTVIFGILTRCDDGFDVHLASGGHPPPLLITADGGVRYVDTVGGQAVGITPNPRLVSTHIGLTVGDTLVLYTDGLTEARTGAGAERYDEDTLIEFASAHAPASPAAIVYAIRSLLDGLGAGVEDDVAILALGVPQPSPT